jgi:DNA-binding FadR family transcriptional regulator
MLMARLKATDITVMLRNRIEEGDWRAGESLPNERMLADEFGAARNTVRCALQVLQNEDLISREVGRGTIVKQRTSDELRHVLDRISGASPLDILNLRLIIEPQVTATAATHASARDIAAIEEANSLANSSEELEPFEKWDNEFHSRIYLSTHNEFLIDFFKLLVVVRYRSPMMAIRQRAFTEERRIEYCEQHAQIMNALKSRNASGASEAMHSHLAARRRYYFGE